MSAPIRVLLLVNQFGLGGAQQMVLNLARHLDRRRFRVAVASFYGRRSLIPYLEEAGAEVIELNVGRKYLAGLPRLYRILRQGRFDIVNAHLPLPGLMGQLATRLARTPVFISTEQMTLDWNRPPFNYLHELNLSFSDGIICISRAVQDSLRRPGSWYRHRGSRAIEVIYNAVDIERIDGLAAIDRVKKRAELGLTTHDYVLINVARLDEQKGQRYLLEAMPLICRAIPRARLLIAGWGPLENDLRAYISGLGLEGRVTMLGERKDVFELLRASDVFVFPTNAEGLGVAILEAMTVGVPVAASNISPIDEFVRDGATGMLFPTQDPPAIAERVTQLYHKPQVAQRLSQQARRFVEEKFSAPSLMKQYEAFYLSLLRQKGRLLPAGAEVTTIPSSKKPMGR